MSKAAKKTKHPAGGRHAGGTAIEISQALSLVSASADSCMALLDANLDFIQASEAFARVRGLQPDQIAGQPHSDLYRPDEQRQLERVRDTGKSSRMAARLLEPATGEDGEATHWDCTLVPISGGDAGVQAILVTETDVTSRVRAERSLHQVAKILAAIKAAQAPVFERIEPQQVLDTLLAEAIQLTESTYGFIGELLPAEPGRAALRIPTILDFDSDAGTPGPAVTHASREVHEVTGDTLLGEVALEHRVAVANDFSDEPRAGGLPEGHPPLTSLLCMPFGDGEHLSGVICIANCPEGYDGFLAQSLEPLLNCYVQQFRMAALDQERHTALAALEQSRNLIRELAVPAVESEHDELVDIINACYEEMEGESDFDAIMGLLQRLDSAIAGHFEHEEQLMQSVCYPDFAAHQKSHEQLLARLRKVTGNYANDPYHDTYDLQDTLTTWFGRHFANQDQRLNLFFAP